MIPYGRQAIDEDDIDAVVAVLRGDWLTQVRSSVSRPRSPRRSTPARGCVLERHGRVARCVCGPRSRRPGRDLAAVVRASAGCARYVGADVSLIDIDPDTLNLDVAAVPGLGALVVHFAGLPVDLSVSPTVLGIIEDAAQTSASTLEPVGNFARSDMTCFSFHQSNSHHRRGRRGHHQPRRARRAASPFAQFHRPETDERWYYEVVETGYNYRLTDVQAALGASQMRKLDAFMARRQIAARYDHELADLDLTIAPRPAVGFEHGYHLYPIRVADRRGVYDGLRDRGIAPQVHYVPIHHHPLYAGEWNLSACDEAYAGILSLPIFPLLTDENQGAVIAALRDLVGPRP